MEIEIKIVNSLNIKYSIFIENIKQFNIDGKVVIITDINLNKLYIEELKKNIKCQELNIITLEVGEKNKNLKTIEEILNSLFKYKLDRKSTLIAFGGGVVGDMTGFSASIYQRGIDFIQIPTTLLAQVDSSVGGKTGINNSYGKNLVGTFHQPKAVYVDISFLKTLPQTEFNAGVAEIIKIAVMFDKDFFCFLEKANLNDSKQLEYVIEKSINLKSNIIKLDEKEKGIRATLNYGHTFAHIIENETSYNKFLHGEAVSIGIIMANSLAYSLDLISNIDLNRIKSCLIKYKLPTSYKIKNIDIFYNKFFLDKKSFQ